MRIFGSLVVVLLVFLAGMLVNELWLSRSAPDASGPDLVRPSETAAEFYQPGAETLGEDEIRISALGTGLPYARHAQAAASWLIELGNGEAFLFDFGTGAAANFNGLETSYASIEGLFFSHLHVDHVGDFDALVVARLLVGSLEPLEVWGPSGLESRLGTGHFVEHSLEAYAWDFESRAPLFPSAGRKAVVHEFDYATPSVVYDRNGVRVVAFPAVHAIDGAVSYRLEWNGRSVVYSGDTTQNKWLVKYGRDADVLIMETFTPPLSTDDLPEDSVFDPESTLYVAMFVHATAAAAGKIFDLTKPRLAVGFHHLDNPKFLKQVESQVRSTYSGPLLLAQDRMIINVRSDTIDVRQAVFDERPLMKPPALGEAGVLAEHDPKGELSDWLAKGRIDYGDLGLPNPGGLRGLALQQGVKILMRRFPDGLNPEELEAELVKLPEPASAEH